MNLAPAMLLGITLLVLAGVADWSTGPEIASAAFYLPAIFWMTWKGGRRIGLGTALTSAVVWLVISLLTRDVRGNPLIAYWNAAVRCITFCLLSILQSEILLRKRVEQRLQQTNAERQKQANILESILNSMSGGVLVADSAGKLLHINPAARRMLPIPANSEGNLDFLTAVFERNSEGGMKSSREENPLLRAARGEGVDEAEVFLPGTGDQDGTWLQVSGRPLRTPDGGRAGGVAVFNDITARKHFERQIADAANREQRRLGEDLHDGLCQQLVSTAFAVRGLASRLEEQKLPEAGDATRIAELVSASISQARDVARGLCLVPLETGGLASALEELALRTTSHQNVECEFIENGMAPDLEETVATNLFRIGQEAVANALKHGKATQIRISLSTDPRQIRVEVDDDGCGLKAEFTTSRGLGMHIMNYRARTIGAALAVEPRSGGGTRVSCTLPRSGLMETPTPAYGD